MLLYNVPWFFFTGLGDLSFHLGGYVCAVISVLSQACYLVYVQKTGVEAGLSTFGVLHLNSINCVPILAIYTIMNNQLMNSFNHVRTTANGFLVSWLSIFLHFYMISRASLLMALAVFKNKQIIPWVTSYLVLCNSHPLLFILLLSTFLHSELACEPSNFHIPSCFLLFLTPTLYQYYGCISIFYIVQLKTAT